MIYYDNWIRRDLPDYSGFRCLYMGPRIDLMFGYRILNGLYDDIMEPSILEYYRDYFTRHPEKTVSDIMRDIIRIKCE